jgi:predicted outer membrane lipoprotein
MKDRRRVNEDDLLLTELMIARSYGRLKGSVMQLPSRACASVCKTVCEHPYATAATAVAGGAAAYGIINMMSPRHSDREDRGRSSCTRQKEARRPDLMQELLPMLLPLVTPYLTSYIQSYLETIQSGERKKA